MTLMGMARNSRLGEEFHDILIESGLTIPEAESYIKEIFNSYSSAVHQTNQPLSPLTQHLSLFTNGYCEVSDIDQFLNGEIALFLSKVYGQLVYSEEPRPNFLKVFKTPNGFVITENVFYDRFPSRHYVASINPKCLDYRTEKDERGGASPLGKALAHSGYAIKYSRLSPSTVEQIGTRYYLSSEFDVESNIVSAQTNGQLHSERPADLDKQLFQITAEYYNAIMLGDKWHRLSFLDEHISDNKKDIEYLFHDNYTLRNTCNERSCLQRMTHGNAMSRHFDSNTSGVDNYLFNSITWLTEGEFTGRELVLGYRSPSDLADWLRGALDANDNQDAYGKVPADYKDTAIIAPESFKTALVNSFNPMFYHGVNELQGTGSVYTIINDFQPR